MKTMICAVLVAATLSPAFAEDFPEDAVKAACERDFPGDFFMQKGCLDLNRDSWSTLDDTVASLPADVGAAILERCRRDFPGDFFMQNGCATLQADSWKSLNN